MADYTAKKSSNELLSKRDLNYLCVLLQNDLKSSGHRNCDLTVNQKVLLNIKTLTS